jgi:hypothetical protein
LRHVFFPEAVRDERGFARHLARRLGALAALGAFVCCSVREEPSWDTYSDTEELLAWHMTYARVIEHRDPTLDALPPEVRERLAATLATP